jgi:hypothetical protein
MKKKKEELTFGDIVAVFIPKLWIIAIVAVCAGALMMLYYAKMFVVEPTLVDGGIDAFLDKILDAKMPRSESDGVV